MFDQMVERLGVNPRITAELAILDGLEASPGPRRIDELTAVLDDGLELLGSAERVDLLRAIARQRSWLDGLEVRAMVAVSERAERDDDILAGAVDPDLDDHADAGVLGQSLLDLPLDERRTRLRDSTRTDSHGQRTDWVREEIAAALRLAPVTAGQRLDLARDLRSKLPLTFAALSEGRISLTHARYLSQALAGFAEPRPDADPEDVVAEQEVLAQSEGWLLRGSDQMTAGELKRRLVLDLVTLAPEIAARRAARKRRERDVTAYPVGDGMAVVEATLPAEDAVAVMNAIDALATRPTSADDDRAPNERRADAFVGAFTGGEPVPTDLLITTRVTSDVDTLTGQSQAPATVDGLGLPVPVPAPTARDLAGMGSPAHDAERSVREAIASVLARLRRAGGLGTVPGRPIASARIGVIDEHGQLIALTPALTGTGSGLRIGAGPLQTMTRSVEAYVPPPLMAEHVRLRWRACAFPGCGRKARRCDNDHGTPHEHGGPTCAANLVPLCRRHHRCKQAIGWTLELLDDGRIAQWITPTGHAHWVTPWEHGPPD